MTKEQEINNLRRQAAEALKIGNIKMMLDFDRQAQAKKREYSNSIFAQIGQQLARAGGRAQRAA